MGKQILIYYPAPTGIVEINEGRNIISGREQTIQINKIDYENGVVEVTRIFFDGIRRREIYKNATFIVYEH